MVVLICYFLCELDSSMVFTRIYTVETWRECYVLEGHPVYS